MSLQIVCKGGRVKSLYALCVGEVGCLLQVMCKGGRVRLYVSCVGRGSQVIHISPLYFVTNLFIERKESNPNLLKLGVD